MKKFYKLLEDAAELTLQKKQEFCDEDKTENNEQEVKKSNNFIPQKIRRLMKRKKSFQIN